MKFLTVFFCLFRNLSGVRKRLQNEELEKQIAPLAEAVVNQRGNISEGVQRLFRRFVKGKHTEFHTKGKKNVLQ